MVERFPDKQRPDISFEKARQEALRRQEYSKGVEVSQESATWLAYGEYPELPIGVSYLTDIHFGGGGVDYELLYNHLETVKDTPNMFLLMGGDIIDAFSPTKHQTGMMADVFNPDEQVEAMMDILQQMDALGKLGAVQVGNHDYWADQAGYRFERFLRELQCPVFQGAGDLHIMVGDQGERYQVYWSHTHFGSSRINITNSTKRALDFSSRNAEIALLGHTHQASAEVFDKAGRQFAGIVGGTYKLHDKWAARWGEKNAGRPGYTLLLWPDVHKFEVVRSPKTARKFIIDAICHAKEQGYIDPYTELLAKRNTTDVTRGSKK